MPRSRSTKSTGPFSTANILAGLVAAAVFTWFIQPVGIACWNFAGSTGSAFFEGFADKVCRAAALGQREQIALHFELTLTAGLFGVTVGSIRNEVSRFLRLRRRKGNKQESATPAPMDGKAIQAEQDRMEEKLAKLRLMVIGAFLMFTGANVFFTALHMLELRMQGVFEQRLAVLAPVVTDLDIKELRASWALMSDRSDFESIKTRIERLAEEKNVKLPARSFPL